MIYLVVLNLPREERYRLENLLIVGCIPGPREPVSINSYLKPLVNDLMKLWDGISIIHPLSGSQIFIRGALIGVACDTPAGRKVCGFSSHSAMLGCSKCLKQFPCTGFGEKK